MNTGRSVCVGIEAEKNCYVFGGDKVRYKAANCVRYQNYGFIEGVTPSRAGINRRNARARIVDIGCVKKGVIRRGRVQSRFRLFSALSIVTTVRTYAGHGGERVEIVGRGGALLDRSVREALGGRVRGGGVR